MRRYSATSFGSAPKKLMTKFPQLAGDSMAPSKPEADVYHSESVACGLLVIQASAAILFAYVPSTLRPQLGSALLPLVDSC